MSKVGAKTPNILVGWISVFLVAVIWSAGADAQTGPKAVRPFVTTHHQIEIAGEPLAYRALVGETVLENDDDVPAATIYSTAYLKDDAAAERPVTFLFNGGPGASSSPLHLGVGPLKTLQSRDAGSVYDETKPDGLAPNPDTILRWSDLVFIDPVGTGFSRLLDAGDGADYWGVEEDARAVLAFIRKWLAANGREGSPHFLVGESYGGTRIAVMLALAGELKFNGAVIISGINSGIFGPGNDLSDVFMFPNYAATAAYYGVVDRGGRSLIDVFDDAAEFAREKLVPAFFLGRRLDKKTKVKLANEMSAMIGVSPEFILADDLRVEPRKFQTELLKDMGLKIGWLDSRYSGPLSDYADKQPPFDDPYMTAGGPSTRPMLEAYLKDSLGFVTDRTYDSLNLNVNSKWNFERTVTVRQGRPGLGGGTGLSNVELLSQAMEKDPHLRLLIVAGLYDRGEAMSSRYAIDHSNIDPARVTYRAYNSGHTVFVNPAVRVEFGQDVGALIDAALQPADMPADH